ncbi:unnamed protein product, partial [Oppiella nova]
PTLSCFGDPIAITPNIDQIATNGYIFTNTFAQQALCAPSRTSLLTSRRPDSIHLYDSHSYWRKSVANFTSLPQYFKQFNYFTQSVGKVFHPGIVSNHSDDYPLSWSAPPFHGSTEKYKFSAVCPSLDGVFRTNIVCPVDVAKQPEMTLPDIQSTQFTLNFLHNYNTTNGNPFFLALGYHKPHIPLKCPKEFLDLYPLSAINLATNRYIPKHMPEVAWNPWMDMKSRDDIKQFNISFPFGGIPDFYQRYIRQSYYACVSYIDDQIGQVLQKLNDKQLANNTIIMLLGDHGWSLGEHNEWSKYSNFDVSVRVPLIISMPHMNATINYQYMSPLDQNLRKNSYKLNKITEIREIVELVDIFPTLSDLAGLPVAHICPENVTQIVCSEGVSVKPLLNPIKTIKKWKRFAFTQYPRPNATPQPNSDQPVLKDIKIMGYSMKNGYMSYTEWVGFDPNTFAGNWSQVVGRELYLGSKQNNNVAYDQRFKQMVRYLALKLRKGWRKVQKGSLVFGLKGDGVLSSHESHGSTPLAANRHNLTRLDSTDRFAQPSNGHLIGRGGQPFDKHRPLLIRVHYHSIEHWFAISIRRRNHDTSNRSIRLNYRRFHGRQLWHRWAASRRPQTLSGRRFPSLLFLTQNLFAKTFLFLHFLLVLLVHTDRRLNLFVSPLLLILDYRCGAGVPHDRHLFDVLLLFSQQLFGPFCPQLGRFQAIGASRVLLFATKPSVRPLLR